MSKNCFHTVGCHCKLSSDHVMLQLFIEKCVLIHVVHKYHVKGNTKFIWYNKSTKIKKNCYIYQFCVFFKVSIAVFLKWISQVHKLEVFLLCLCLSSVSKDNEFCINTSLLFVTSRESLFLCAQFCHLVRHLLLDKYLI